MTCLQNALDPSSVAAAAPGLEQRIPAAGGGRRCRPRGRLGPDHDEADLFPGRRQHQPVDVVAGTSRIRASPAIPALPGAHSTPGRRGGAVQRLDDRMLARARADD